MKILILEASTTSAKAMLYHAKDGVLAVDSVPYDASFSDIKTQDADRVTQSVFALGRRLAAGHEISAIAVSGTWHNIMVCHRDGRPKTRAYTWTYTDAAEKAAQIRQNTSLTQDFYRRTGCMPILPIA